ncbi:hypothetical protein DFH05DRAFT_1468357 [Lentinula detonsa]|uniref:Alpha/beta hydrolase fold-3 domain-containing protein n=1 Tax=Lentinula detonsa TaxID=2804962 RepID=A0A9W8PBH0_9AGAR|nr:hypothetical protein DFH05DRAFT_1468357 [Lentinula detonsa]
MFPVSEMVFKFWKYAQLEWEKQGLEVGIAILSYSMSHYRIPTLQPEHSATFIAVGPGKDAAFPIQLIQAIHALKHLLSIGCNLSDIQLVGDSAGGNLVAQLLLHMVHPLPLPSNLVPPLDLLPGARLRGVYMMSPWVSLSDPGQWGSSIHTKDNDIIIYKTARRWGDIYVNNIGNGVLSNVSPAQLLPYAEPILAPNNWYSHLPKIVNRILVSAGKEERLLNQVQALFDNKIKPYFGDVDGTLVLQDGGVHDDPMLDFAVSDVPLGNPLTAVVVEWIKEGFIKE